MRKLFVILLLLPSIGLSQFDLDSLKGVWKDKNQADSVRVIALGRIAWEGYVFSQPDTAFYYAQLQYELSEKIGNKKYMANALNTQGVVFWLKGDFKTAADYFLKNKSIYEELEDSLGLATSLNNLGLVYREYGDFVSSIDYFMKSVKISERMGNKDGAASAHNNIAIIHLTNDEYQKAEENYESCLAIYKELGNKKGIATALNNLGNVFRELNEFDKAIQYYEESITIAQEVEDMQGLGNALMNLAHIDLAELENANKGGVEVLDANKIHRVDSLLKLALEKYELVQDKRGIASCNGNFAMLYFLTQDYNKAVRFGEKAVSIAQDYGGVLEIEGATKVLFQCYEKVNNYEKALSTMKLHIKMRDSISSNENQKAVIQQQAQYEYEKQKAIDDAEHDKQLAIEQEAKEKQTILTYATAGGLGFVGIFLVFVFSRLRVTRKQKNVIELAHTELEEKNQEILDSISYAKRIQSAILPPDKVVKSYLEKSFVMYKPKDIVAGDFYWMEPVGDKVLFAAADCTGHGVPGAMVSVVCNNGLNRSVREYGLTDPGKILDKTKEIVVQEFEKSEEEVKDGMDIALCSLQGNKLQYAGAHNPLWIIRKSANEVEEIKANKQPIGKTDQSVNYTTHTIALNEGDCFYIFSDGFADQFGGEKGKKMKTVNFKKLLLSIKDKGMDEQLQHIDKAFANWKGELEQLDDVCVMGVRV